MKKKKNPLTKEQLKCLDEHILKEYHDLTELYFKGKISEDWYTNGNQNIYMYGE